MKNLNLLQILLFAFSIAMNAQTNILPDSGNLGIGTTTPKSLLHISAGSSSGEPHNFSNLTVEDDANAMISILTPPDSKAYYGFSDTDDNFAGGIEYDHSTDKMKLRVNKHNSDMVIDSKGNVGIGTVSPLSNLHIDGGRVNGLIWPLIVNNSHNAYEITNYGVGIKLKHSNNNEDYKWSGIASIQESIWANDSGLAFFSNEKEHMRLSKLGNLGIGTKKPGNYKLAVNGKIRAKEVRVETNWADYVFKDDYDLPSLEEVERHIKEKGHLIHIPSAKDVSKNGIQLGEMNKLLLEKIEELTLYTLQQAKQIKAQNKTNKQLEARIESLEMLVLSITKNQ